MTKHAILAGLIGLSFCFSTAAETILDFQALEHQSHYIETERISEDGFTIQDANSYVPNGLLIYGTENQHYMGSTAIINSSGLVQLELKADDNRPFDLLSVDLGRPYNFATRDTRIKFVGQVLGSGTVEQLISFPSRPDMATYPLDPDFVNLTSVTWFFPTNLNQFLFAQVDNIRINAAPPAIPTPTASLVGVLGFGAIALRRRKR